MKSTTYYVVKCFCPNLWQKHMDYHAGLLKPKKPHRMFLGQDGVDSYYFDYCKGLVKEQHNNKAALRAIVSRDYEPDFYASIRPQHVRSFKQRPYAENYLNEQQVKGFYVIIDIKEEYELKREQIHEFRGRYV